jgi:hypothetical protein
MPVGKVTALATALVAAILFSDGVKSDMRSATEPAAAAPPRQLVKPLKSFLNDDSPFETASTGFQSAEDFAAALHAARNTRVPFAILKRQLVDERRTLAEAIAAVKPGANATLEADLARSEAKADFTAIR